MDDSFPGPKTLAALERGIPFFKNGLRLNTQMERYNVVAHAKKLGDIANEIMRQWESYDIVRQARGNGLLLGVSFVNPESADAEEKDWWTARAVRGKMLENGVWALSDHEDTIRMYPALNMEEPVLRKGLQSDGGCYPAR